MTRTGSNAAPGAGAWTPSRLADGALAAFVVLLVGMMVVPLPTALLDVLLASNVAVAVLLLLVALHLRDGLALSAFPTLLLVTTLYRLALNISSTRLILLQADAGSVIRAFGGFVVQGNYVVGAIVFLLLTIVQFLVIARGSERVAEVAARFALDAMPGKQMSIDAELRAGAIGQDEARRRRRELQRESELYGAMDGAMKFVKGDAVAGILITIVNVLGGLGVGVGMRGMDLGASLETYGLLTIGDGLVSQIPALLISTAAGVVVTRVASEDESQATSLGSEVGTQVFGDPRSLGIAAGFLAALAVIPGLPAPPFLVLAGTFFVLARTIDRARAEAATPEDAATRIEVARASRTRPERVPTTTPVAIALGTDLATRVLDEQGRGGPLLDRALPALREQLFDELGLTLPGVRVRADPGLSRDDGFRLLLDEVPVAEGHVPPGLVWVDAPAQTLRGEGIAGAVDEETLDPAGRPGPRARVPVAAVADLADLGYVPEDAADVLAASLGRWVRRRGADLVGLQEVQTLVDQLEGLYPAVVRHVVPRPVSMPLLTDVLRRLADEGVSIRPLRRILEALAVHGQDERDPLALTELVRVALARSLTHRASAGGALPAILLDADVEDALEDAIQQTPSGRYLALAPALARELVARARREVDAARQAGVLRPVFLCRGETRRFFRRLVETELPDVPVLSYAEVAPEAPVTPVAHLGLAGA